MPSAIHALCLALVLGAPPVDTRFVQLAPLPKDPGAVERTPGQQRAVVLVHGLHPHPFSNANVHKALFASWQEPGSPPVRRLAREADVFAYAYAQTVAVEQVADAPGLGDGVARLRERGYTEVVLVGHSAGGLVCRHFVEDHPDAGVAKVIQVCSPNGGSCWGKATAGVRHDQEDFLRSLSTEGRQRCLKQRSGKKIPDGVEFVCVVATRGLNGDNLVTCPCQWTEDLQGQGVPAVAVELSHHKAIASAEGAEQLARLVRESQPRWDPAQVAAARPKVLKEREPKR
jgi:pimeloyl-ACP methyl ester carboxylesterase